MNGRLAIESNVCVHVYTIYVGLIKTPAQQHAKALVLFDHLSEPLRISTEVSGSYTGPTT